MGAAASKDFLEGGAKTTVGRELDELGGYDRPALAKNQSFTARLDWLGTQVGKASEQLESALSKDDQAGRRELEKEAKRRQLMAMRRGQGDILLNAQFAEFYLKQKQFERPPGSASILRQAEAANDAADAALAEVASPKPEAAAARNLEHATSMQRIYSSRNGPASQGGKSAAEASGGAAAGGAEGAAKEEAPPSPKPVPVAPRSPVPGSRWRQTVAQAKKTAFLAVGSVLALQNKKKTGPSRIDNFAIYAEQQLGEGMAKFIEESDRLGTAREKLPGLKAELEKLRVVARQLAMEQEAALAAVGGEEALNEEDEEEEATEELAAINEDDAMAAEEAAAVAANAAANMRHKRRSNTGESNKPHWHFASKSNGFGPPPSLSALKAKSSPRQRESNSGILSTPPGHSAPPSPGPSPGIPSVSPHGIASSFNSLGSRRRVGGNPALSQSLNGPVSMLTSTSTPGSAPGSAPGSGAGSLASTSLTRGPPARQSWSGAVSTAEASGPPSPVPGGGAEAGRASSSGSSGVPLRPSRPTGPALTPRSAQPTTFRSRSEPAQAPGTAPAAAVGTATAARPASAMRASLLASRPASGGGSAVGPPPLQKIGSTRIPVGDSPRGVPDSPSGEYRVGTMAQRLGARAGSAPPRAAAKAHIKALREAETANVMRQAQLVQAIEESSSILQTAGGLLNMYCNRSNGRWVEQQQWALPHVHEAALPSVRRQAENYRELVMKDLKAGKLAVLLHVDDDVFQSNRLGPLALWSADPWQLLEKTHPARAEWTAHLVGLGMGVRQLLALATAVEAVAGPEAVAKMVVVVACHEGQVDAVVRDISARKLCRFNPENLVIVVQKRTPGHLFDRSRRTFIPTPEAPPRPSGSGYTMLALNWTGDDIFRLGGADFTQRIPMEKSTLALLEERDVQWLSSWRLRDLVHYSPEHCLNLEQLAISYALADSLDANMSMQVDLVETMIGVNRSGAGIVLALKERAKPPAVPVASAATAPLLRPRPESTRPGVSSATAQAGASAAGTSGAGPSSATGSNPSEGMWPSLASTTRPMSPAPPAGEAPPSLRQPVPPDQPPPPSHPHPHLRKRPQSPLVIPSDQQPAEASSPVPPLPGTTQAWPTPGAGQRSALSTGARAGGIGTEGGPLPTCDVKWADVNTPALATGLQALIDSATAQTGNPPRLAVSIKRYAFHVPSLKAIVTSPSVFRPCLSVGENGYLYVTFDASDLSALPTARCVAITFSSRSAAPGAQSGQGALAASNSREAAAAAEGRSGINSAPASHLPPLQGVLPGGSAAHGPLPALGGSASPSRPNSGPAAPLRKAGPAIGRGGARPGSGGSATTNVSNASVALAAAQAAAAQMLRGRLLTNDYDLDTLAWAVSDQDGHPGFRASVSLTNTSRSRVTATTAGGAAAATGQPMGPNRAKPSMNAIVVAVADDPASALAVRVAMAIMKPGADCLHVLTIAKDVSATAIGNARAVADRFETMAAATLGDVRSVVQVKHLSIVEDILAYAESVRAVLLVTGSMSLAATSSGPQVVGSVALSLARDCSRPILVVKSNARLAESAYEVGKKPCLRALLAAEPTGRPFVRYVVGHVLDGARGDKLVLLRGRAFDAQMNELASSRRILDHLADEAASNRRFDLSQVVRRMVPAGFEVENQRVADADQCHIVGVQVPDGRGPLPGPVVNLMRTSRAAVLLYRSQANRPAPHAHPPEPHSPAPEAAPAEAAPAGTQPENAPPASAQAPATGAATAGARPASAQLAKAQSGKLPSESSRLPSAQSSDAQLAKAPSARSQQDNPRPGSAQSGKVQLAEAQPSETSTADAAKEGEPAQDGVAAASSEGPQEA